MTELTHEELTRLLDYDPETGVFRWKVGIGRVKEGSVAGANSPSGKQIKLKRKPRLSRHLAWFYVNGEMPRNRLFVKNGDRYDDRIDNIGMLPDKPKELTHEYLKQCIDYNPDTGEFKWRITQGGSEYGNDAFCFNLSGSNYSLCQTSILNKLYKTLRLIVFWMTGFMPSPNRCVMPIDNNILNMKWSNIKVGSQSDVLVKSRVRGSCAMKGVSWDKSKKKYSAYVSINGKQKYIGLFKTERAAHEAYMKAARKHYGELANDGYEHAIYHMEWEKIEQPPVNLADELLQSAQEAVDIAEGRLEPSVVHEPFTDF